MCEEMQTENVLKTVETIPKLNHCRFCAEINKIENLLDLTQENILKELYEIVQQIKLDIDIISDVLPKTICKCCWQSLKESYVFLSKVKQSQITLFELYNNSQLMSHVKQENNRLINAEFEYDSDVYIEFKKEQDNPYTEKNIQPLNCTDATKHFEFGNRINEKDSQTFKNDNLGKGITDIIPTFNDTKNISWEEYNWLCVHCDAKFKCIDDLRKHSKIVHATCFGFKCVDCDELFNYFNPFIEHVRQHREALRLHCQYCNKKLSSPGQTQIHTLTHWHNAQICEFCGDILPNITALQRHKKIYKKLSLPQRRYKKIPRRIKCDISWKEYPWTCQDCLLRLPSLPELRLHTREVHHKCFSIKCCDCLFVMNNFKQFVEHVVAHRSCLKNYCQYCNKHYPNITSLDDHITTHFLNTKPCDGCGEIFKNSSDLTEHMTLYDSPRIRGRSSDESLTCGVCRKHFPNGFQLKNHKVIHNEKRERDQICHSCGKGFYDAKTLTNHIRTHFNKTETCEICKKTFLTKQRLKVHLTTHLEAKQFVCNECGKEFRRKSQEPNRAKYNVLHLASHSDLLPFECQSCHKSFRLLSYLKIHERQHTGIRPFTCEICSETFNHWGNCNRHMIRKHGITLAKTKITKQGKLDINRQTGEAKTLEIKEDVKEWCEEMLRPKKRGRKRKCEKLSASYN